MKTRIRTTLLIILMTSLVLIAGCTAPLSVIDNGHPLPNEVANTTISYTVGGTNNILLPKGGGNYVIHAETLSRGYSATFGYQYLTISPNDRFGNTGKLVTHGWTSLTTSDGYLGYSDENSIMNTTFTIPPNAVDSGIVIYCTFHNGITMIQPCGTIVSIKEISE